MIMGTRERRQREAETRRREILNVARELFWKSGYTATTMPQIAAAAELAPGTLYLYFSGKDALYAELLHEGYDRLQERLEAAVHAGRTPRDRAARLIDEFFDFARKNPEYFDIIFFLLHSAGTGGRKAALSPAEFKRLDARVQQCTALASSVLREVCPDLSVKQLACRVDAVWSMITGAVFYFRGDKRFDDVAGETRRIILAGLA